MEMIRLNNGAGYRTKSLRGGFKELVTKKTKELGRKVTTEDMHKDDHMFNPHNYMFTSLYGSFEKLADQVWREVRKELKTGNDSESEETANATTMESDTKPENESEAKPDSEPSVKGERVPLDREMTDKEKRAQALDLMVEYMEQKHGNPVSKDWIKKNPFLIYNEVLRLFGGSFEAVKTAAKKEYQKRHAEENGARQKQIVAIQEKIAAQRAKIEAEAEAKVEVEAEESEVTEEVEVEAEVETETIEEPVAAEAVEEPVEEPAVEVETETKAETEVETETETEAEAENMEVEDASKVKETTSQSKEGSAKSKTLEQTWTKEKVIESLTSYYKQYGDFPQFYYLRKDDLEKYNLPSYATIKRRLGTYDSKELVSLLELQDVEVDPNAEEPVFTTVVKRDGKGGRPPAKKYSKKEILNILKKIYEEKGELPRGDTPSDELKEMGLPPYYTISNVLGTWSVKEWYKLIGKEKPNNAESASLVWTKEKVVEALTNYYNAHKSLPKFYMLKGEELAKENLPSSSTLKKHLKSDSPDKLIKILGLGVEDGETEEETKEETKVETELVQTQQKRRLPTEQVWTKEAVIEALRKYYVEFGDIPVIAGRRSDFLAEHNLPSYNTLHRVLGTSKKVKLLKMVRKAEKARLAEEKKRTAVEAIKFGEDEADWNFEKALSDGIEPLVGDEEKLEMAKEADFDNVDLVRRDSVDEELTEELAEEAAEETVQELSQEEREILLDGFAACVANSMATFKAGAPTAPSRLEISLEVPGMKKQIKFAINAEWKS